MRHARDYAFPNAVYIMTDFFLQTSDIGMSFFYDIEHEISNIEVTETLENRQKKRPDMVVSGRVY